MMSLVYAAAALLLWSSFVVAEVQSLAVLPLDAQGLTENDAAVLTDALRSRIGQSGRFKVVERTRMNDIFREQGLQMSGICIESSCAVEMGQVLGVRRILMGSVGLIGKTYTLNVRIVDVGSGKIEKEVTEYQKRSKDNLLTETVPLVVSKLTGDVSVKKKSKTKIALISAGVAVAVAIPVILFSLKRKDTDSGLKWIDD